MILHYKNAEMTILLSFLHFYSVKSYNFRYFFSPIQICFRLNKKIFLVIFIFIFFPSSDLNILEKISVHQVLKKIKPKKQQSSMSMFSKGVLMTVSSSFSYIQYIHFQNKEIY